MSTQSRNYTIRLSATGKRQLEKDLMTLGVSGQKSLKLIQKAAKPASRGLKETDSAARGLKAGLRSVSQELPALQRLARFMGTTALIGGLIAFGKTSLDVSRLFQASMKRVEGVTRATSGEMESLTSKAMEMGATTAFTASQAADAMEVLAKNGLSVSQILGGALEATLSMAAALGSELAPSADLATDLMLQFQLRAADLPGIADAVTGAALTSKLGFNDLKLAIGQAGGVAGKFGVDIGDFLTALSATSSGFASGSDAGTSFKNFLQRLVPQSNQASDAMKDLGLEFFDANGQMKSMADISEELKIGIAGLSDVARNGALQKIFGTDAIRTALLLADQGADGFRDLAAALGEVSAQDQAQIRLEGLDGALKELAAAWEAVQLESSQNGGLDVAEASVDRLTSALRYLSENFTEVEEVASRMARALIVVLVGKGIKLAVAQTIAMRAAYIELAGSVSGIGTAASRSLAPLTRLGIAGRALTGMMGGPLGLAITAASLAALAIDWDNVSDAIEGADTAGRGAADALTAYAEASRLAAQEQEGLSGKVSATTANLVAQGRVAVQGAILAQKAAQDELLATILGEGIANPDHIDDTIKLMFKQASREWKDQGEIAPRPNFNRDSLEFNNLGPVFQDLADSLYSLKSANPDFLKVAAGLNTIGGAGDEVLTVISELDVAMSDVENIDLDAARDHMIALAGELGGFKRQLAEITEADSEFEILAGFEKLRAAMYRTVAASKVLHNEGEESILAMVSALAAGELSLNELGASLDKNWSAAQEKPEGTFAGQVAEDARDAADQLERMGQAHDRYNQRGKLIPGSTDRGAYPRSEIAAAKKGILNLIALVEGTDKGRGYNETLAYGRFTDGPVNLISMTLREVLALQKQMLQHPENTYNSSAAGRYQIVSTTLKDLIKNLGLSGDELFDAKMQDRLATELVRRRMGQGQQGFFNEWEGFRSAGTPWSTIQTGLGAQSIPTADTGVSRKNTAAEENRVRILKAQEEALRRLIETGHEQAAQLELEVSLIGLSASEQARLTFMHQALTAAKKAGIDVDAQLTESGEKLIDVIRAQADAIAERTTQQEQGDASWGNELDRINQSKDAVRSAFENLKPGGEGIKGFWDDILGHISNKLWDFAFDPVWDLMGRLLDGLLGGIGGGGPKLKLFAGGGAIPGLADGGGMQVGGRARGLLPGQGHGRQDNILFWGSAGEYMQPASAVDYYGEGFMEAVRNRRLPRLADGGMVGLSPTFSSSSRFGSGGSPMDIAVKVDVRAHVDDDGNWRAEVERITSPLIGQGVKTGMKIQDDRTGQNYQNFAARRG